MQYALINNTRIEAQPKLQALCACCSGAVIAKCGTRNIWHWAHKSKTQCDHWWEPETAWHRNWKNNYPVDWQENTMFDETTGEKHIADVRTEYDLVVEFQHSAIDPQERNSREQFYKNMVWIVDGSRLKRDYPRFLKEWKGDKGLSEVYETDQTGGGEVWFPEWCFSEAWLNSSVPVIFDYFGDGTLDDPEGYRNNLYCLFPQVGRRARFAVFSRQAFLKTTSSGEWSSRVQNFIDDFKKQDEIARKAEEQTTSYSYRRTYRLIGTTSSFRGYLRRFR